jgi:hypothetical protein
MWFEGKWMQLEDIMLSEVSQVQKDKGHVFSHMWKTDPKDTHISKTKHNHIQTYVQHVCNGELLYGTQREGKKRASTLSKYVTFVQVEYVTICVESC